MPDANFEQSRQTPAPIKRQLRQEAGFGCCVCGHPILQYHHIVEWSKDPHFRPEDMMVLCPNDHDRAAKGAFPEDEQRAFKASPFNIKRKLAKGLLAVKQTYAGIALGSVIMVNEGPFITIGAETVLGLKIIDNVLHISLKLYSKTGDLLCAIEDNEWLSGDPIAWDIEADWQRLTVREKHGSINLSLNAKKIPVQLLAEFWNAGCRVKIDDRTIYFDGVALKNVKFTDISTAGITLRLLPDKLNLDPSGDGVILGTGSSQREKLWSAVDAWKQVKARRAANSGT